MDVCDVSHAFPSRGIGGEIVAHQVRSPLGVFGGEGGNPPWLRLARHQAQFAHEGPYELGAGLDVPSSQRGVYTPVAVRLVGVIENVLDENFEFLATSAVANIGRDLQS